MNTCLERPQIPVIKLVYTRTYKASIYSIGLILRMKLKCKKEELHPEKNCFYQQF